MCWLKDLVNIHQKLTFANNILLELEKIKLPLCDFDYTNTFRNQKVFKPIATGKARDENLESDRTSSMSEKTKIAILAILKSFKQPFYR